MGVEEGRRNSIQLGITSKEKQQADLPLRVQSQGGGFFLSKSGKRYMPHCKIKSLLLERQYGRVQRETENIGESINTPLLVAWHGQGIAVLTLCKAVVKIK